MAESESEEAVRLRNKASEMRKSTRSVAFPGVTENCKSSYFLTTSLGRMVNEDPVRLQNQSCVIREEIVRSLNGEKRTVYSSLARLPTFSIGLASTADEAPPRAPLRESSVDRKYKYPHRYFQMPVLGATVFVGDGGGFDTITCQLFYEDYQASKFDFDSEFAPVRSLYKEERPGGLSGWLRARPAELRRYGIYSEVILSGTELFVGPHVRGQTTVGNLGGKSSRVSGSSSDYRDCTGDETIRQPSDIVEQPGHPVPGVCSEWGGSWKSFEGPDLFRSTEGSYLEKPKLTMNRYAGGFPFDHWNGDVLQLTRFDDFIILGSRDFDFFLDPAKVIDIVRKNASETADVIAAHIVKAALERISYPPWLTHPITAVVIFLDHKEILLREHRKEKKESMIKKYMATLLGLLGLKGISQSTVLRDDKKNAKLKEEEKMFVSQVEDKKGVMKEENQKVKILGGELLPNVPQVAIDSLEENELGMKSTTISSNLTIAEVQDGSEASSPIVNLIEDDDCESEDLMVSRHLTKWIIYGDLLERTLLCFFNMEEMQYEFYFEDHESMATIIGLGVPHSKVVFEHGSPHVTIVEIPQEDWDEVWAHSNVIPPSIPKGYVLKQERFLDILHRIANVINSDNIVSKVNNWGVGGDKGKGKAHGNADDGKGQGKAEDPDDPGNTRHPDGGSNGPPNDDDKKERKEKDGNDDKKVGRDRDDGKTCKEVQAVVHLFFLPGGDLEEEKEMEMKGVGCKGVEKKKKKKRKGLWHALRGVEKGNAIGNQQTPEGVENGDSEGVEDGDIDENLKQQFENQIHAQMVFTFTIKDEAGGPLKTIQATIDPITFQFPSKNKENYLQRKRFGWFHEELEVAFGVDDAQAAYLDARSCKALHSFEAKEVNSQGNSKGKAKTSANTYKGKAGVKYVVDVRAEYGRTNGSEDRTTEEVQNSWETNKAFTKGGFIISEHTDLNSQQLKYSYFPHFPFNEKEFEAKDKGDRLKMYHLNPICQLQRVSCKGTWYPKKSKQLEAYKLEACRELGMTRIYNVDHDLGEEEKQKGVRKVEKNLPLCFIQKLEKVVYLNHAMSHLTSSLQLTSSPSEEYRLGEQQDPNDPSTTFLTQAQYEEVPNWPSNDPLVDVKQERNI